MGYTSKQDTWEPFETLTNSMEAVEAVVDCGYAIHLPVCINENSYNFTLRVGMNIKSVVAGVIGARKPQYAK